MLPLARQLASRSLAESLVDYQIEVKSVLAKMFGGVTLLKDF